MLYMKVIIHLKGLSYGQNLTNSSLDPMKPRFYTSRVFCWVFLCFCVYYALVLGLWELYIFSKSRAGSVRSLI